MGGFCLDTREVYDFLGFWLFTKVPSLSIKGGEKLWINETGTLTVTRHTRW
jgi:hypothetical protein